jgi:hypothetical protein
VEVGLLVLFLVRPLCHFLGLCPLPHFLAASSLHMCIVSPRRSPIALLHPLMLGPSSMVPNPT